LNDLALDAHAAAVDDADLRKPALDGLIEVFLEHNMDLPGLKAMQVDGVLDRDVVHAESI
jgi:hypothetical protein